MDGPRRFPDWVVSGAKRSHTEMEGRGSRSTRSPSLTENHASTSNPRPQTSDARRSSHITVRLPSFRELEAQRPRAFDTPPRQRTETPRPNMANRGVEVIDLTGDDGDPAPQQPSPNNFSFGLAQRGPRFPGADIIDLSADTPPQPMRRRAQSQHGNNPQHSSPEIQFVRVRPRSPRLQHAGATPAPEGMIPAGAEVIDITDDADDDIQILREQLRRGHHRIPHGHNYRFASAHDQRAIMRIFLRHPAGADARMRDYVRRHVPDREFPFVPPLLNFGAVGFHLGYEEEDDVEDDRDFSVPPAAGPPPPPAPEGFTRSPFEQDVLLCPNCDEELSVGEADVKRQVWMVKGCGHIYCGECTVNRAITKRKRGKERDVQRTRTFKECVVEGCGKRATGAQMVQLFL